MAALSRYTLFIAKDTPLLNQRLDRLVFLLTAFPQLLSLLPSRLHVTSASHPGQGRQLVKDRVAANKFGADFPLTASGQ